MKTLLFFLVATVMILGQSNIDIKLKLPAIFSDNMVLQQKMEAPFWGKAVAGEKISIETSWGEKSETEVQTDGNWILKIKTPNAGGPYEVKVSNASSSIEFKNVLIGEVWIGSGQSNMEMPLMGWPPNDLIEGSDDAIANSTNTNIRLFTVAREFSIDEQFDCVGNWVESSPQTSPGFSAALYFFGKKLYEELKIPIGLIHSSWGGTPVESWIQGKYISQHPDYKDYIQKLEESKPHLENLKNWIANHPTIDMTSKQGDDMWKNLSFNDEELSNINYDNSKWNEMNLPQQWENTEVGYFDGAVWFRKKIEIPNTWLNKELQIHLAMIDDMDVAFVNGVKVGATEVTGRWQEKRVYKIPKELVNANQLTIAVRVVDTQGGGGIYGQDELMKIHPVDSNEVISLAGKWKYLPVAEYLSGKFFVYNPANHEFFNRPKELINVSAYSPTTLFNAMINPLIPYSIKGAIWYQGESNTGNPEAYKTLFPMMIKTWREEWKQGDFPFYYAQIAPYKYGEGTNSQKLREVQLHTLSVPNTGMAVTMDIGNPLNIHPGKKKEVGDRLAMWALVKNYGKKLPYSGPVYKSMKVEEGKAILYFDFADRLEIKLRDGKNNFQIAGKDKNFVEADVIISGNELIVSSSKVKEPVAVRYCWSDTDEGTLFNEAGLPASSFRTDDWDD